MTLIELMVTVSIAAILATLAAPSFIRFLKKSEMQSLSNDFTGDIQQARAEAIKRNMCATMCKAASGINNNVNSAAPRCGTTGDDWAAVGWILYLNPTCKTTVNASDPADPANIISIRQISSTRYTLVSTRATPVRQLTFRPRGTLSLALTERFTLQDSTDTNSPMNRSICVDMMGRSRIITESGTC